MQRRSSAEEQLIHSQLQKPWWYGPGPRDSVGASSGCFITLSKSSFWLNSRNSASSGLLIVRSAQTKYHLNVSFHTNPIQRLQKAASFPTSVYWARKLLPHSQQPLKLHLFSSSTGFCLVFTNIRTQDYFIVAGSCVIKSLLWEQQHRLRQLRSELWQRCSSYRRTDLSWTDCRCRVYWTAKGIYWAKCLSFGSEEEKAEQFGWIINAWKIQMCSQIFAFCCCVNIWKHELIF